MRRGVRRCGVRDGFGAGGETGDGIRGGETGDGIRRSELCEGFGRVKLAEDEGTEYGSGNEADGEESDDYSVFDRLDRARSGAVRMPPPPIPVPVVLPSVGVGVPDLPAEAVSSQRLVRGLTTFGEEIELHTDQILREVQEANEISEDLYTYLKSLDEEIPRKNLLSKKFVLFQFTAYCPASVMSEEYLLPAELAVGLFCLEYGVMEATTGLLDPGQTPMGLRSAALESAKKFRLPEIGKHDSLEALTMDTNCAVTIFIGFALELGVRVGDYFYVFATKDNIPVVQRILKWLCVNVKPLVEHWKRIRVVSICQLVIQMCRVMGETSPRSAKVFNYTEGAVDKVIENSPFSGQPEMACVWHQQEENKEFIEKCCGSVIHRVVQASMAFANSLNR